MKNTPPRVRRRETGSRSRRERAKLVSERRGICAPNPIVVAKERRSKRARRIDYKAMHDGDVLVEEEEPLLVKMKKEKERMSNANSELHGGNRKKRQRPMREEEEKVVVDEKEKQKVYDEESRELKHQRLGTFGLEDSNEEVEFEEDSNHHVVPRKVLHDKVLIFSDIETTGFEQPEPISWALVVADLSGAEIARHEWRIKPSKKSSVDAIRVHGIENESLVNKPRFGAVLAAVQEWLCALPGVDESTQFTIVFHNGSRCELPVLLRACRSHSVEWPIDRIPLMFDTLAWYRALARNGRAPPAIATSSSSSLSSSIRTSFKLGPLFKVLTGVDLADAHNAPASAAATMSIFTEAWHERFFSDRKCIASKPDTLPPWIVDIEHCLATKKELIDLSTLPDDSEHFCLSVAKPALSKDGRWLLDPPAKRRRSDDELLPADIAFHERVEQLSLKKRLGQPKNHPFRSTRTRVSSSAWMVQEVTPLSLFSLLWPADIWEQLKKETNAYAAELKAEADRKGFNKWKAVSVPELKVYMAIWIVAGIQGRTRRMEDWWNTNESRVFLFARNSSMSRDRFLAIKRALHLTDKRTDAREQLTYDPHSKYEWLQARLNETFPKYYEPGRYLSVDEGGIANKGRCALRQYNKDKPTKRFIKMWMCACSLNNYLLSFQVYGGKRHGFDYARDDVDTLGAKVALHLVRNYEGTKRSVICDSFFSSLMLSKSLLKVGLLSCGTLQERRVGLPEKSEEFFVTKKEAVKASRGASRYAKFIPSDEGEEAADALLGKALRHHSIYLVNWVDSKPIAAITNLSGPLIGEHRVKRRASFGGRVQVPVPHDILLYNEHMGGVDQVNQMRQSYSSHQPRTLRWWTSVFHWMFDVTVCNANVLYKCWQRNYPDVGFEKYRTGADFRYDLAESLVAAAASAVTPVDSDDDEATTTGSSPSTPRLRKNTQKHAPISAENKLRRRCACGRRTRFKCRFCDTFVCIGESTVCWERLHE
jgi:DNA polymerase III epsilon subunit-like protein